MMYWQLDMEEDERQWNWWPGVTRDVRKYVEGYDLCQRMKNRTEELAGKLKLSEVPQKT